MFNSAESVTSVKRRNMSHSVTLALVRTLWFAVLLYGEPPVWDD